MKKGICILSASIVLVVLLSACSSFESKTQSDQSGLGEFPSFEQENAALIDKTLSELKIADLVNPVIKKTEKSIVVSMEDTVSKSNSNYNYLQLVG